MAKSGFHYSYLYAREALNGHALNVHTSVYVIESTSCYFS